MTLIFIIGLVLLSVGSGIFVLSFRTLQNGANLVGILLIGLGIVSTMGAHFTYVSDYEELAQTAYEQKIKYSSTIYNHTIKDYLTNKYQQQFNKQFNSIQEP